jgi:methylase of polypeptide subunit release factors
MIDMLSQKVGARHVVPLRAVWRWLLRWRFRLFQAHRHDRLVLETVVGKPFLVLPQVLNPKLFRTGEFLVQVLNPELVPPGSTVLDMGTGSGIGAVFAAEWAAGPPAGSGQAAGRVVAVDVNPMAVRCARINVLLHGVENRVDVREGDLFAPVAGERFDVVLFNPPFLRGTPETPLEQALWADDVVERFAAGLRHHLAADGRALVVLSSDGDVDTILGAFRAEGLAPSVVARRDLINEMLTVYRFDMAEEPSEAAWMNGGP